MDWIEALGASIYGMRVRAAHRAYLAEVAVASGAFTLRDLNDLAWRRTGRVM